MYLFLAVQYNLSQYYGVHLHQLFLPRPIKNSIIKLGKKAELYSSERGQYRGIKTHKNIHTSIINIMIPDAIKSQERTFKNKSMCYFLLLQEQQITQFVYLLESLHTKRALKIIITTPRKASDNNCSYIVQHLSCVRG